MIGELRRVIYAWPAIFRVAFAGMVAYRAEMVIWVLSATLPLVMMALWNAAASGGPVNGWDQIELARYFTLNLVVRQLTGSWIVWELNWNIRQGDLSPKLLRPMHPLVFNTAETVSALPFRLMVLTPLVGILLVWRPEILFWSGWGIFFAFVVSTLFSLAIQWMVQAIFGLLAFWFDDATGFWSAWFSVWALCGGYFVPLDLFPDHLISFVRWLPFYSTLGAPIDVAMGNVGVLPTLGVQVGWMVVLVGVTSAMWSAGIRRYGAVGA